MTLLDHVRADSVPVMLERVIEVTHKDWNVMLVSSKHPRLALDDLKDKFICRPCHMQSPHTGQNIITHGGGGEGEQALPEVGVSNPGGLREHPFPNPLSSYHLLVATLLDYSVL